MKKIKLLTSLGAVTALGGGVAFTATSCSNSDKKTQDFDSITFSGNEIYPNTAEYPTKVGDNTTFSATHFLATKGDEKEIKITKVSAKSKDTSKVEINNLDQANFSV
ncbi:MAG: hypothetical protein HUJ62_00470 [Streptococcus gallolyticus]|nr:hypothetical protein [Streptococcus gallolyticus]